MGRTALMRCALFLLCAGLQAHASGIQLNFLGLKDQEPVQNFYNGGTGGFGSSKGLNYGLTFSSNTLAIKSYLQGGSGGFVEPHGGSAIFFTGTTPGVMNSAAGFSGGLSFFFAAGASATVTVWSGANGTGNILASITLSPNSGGACGVTYCTWTFVPLPFAGEAGSVVFAGAGNQLGISNVNVGSTLAAVPEPSSLLLVGTGVVGLWGKLRRRPDGAKPASL